MVKIRLRRIGKKGQPSYRVVVTTPARRGRAVHREHRQLRPMREPSSSRSTVPEHWTGSARRPALAGGDPADEIAGVIPGRSPHRRRSRQPGLKPAAPASQRSSSHGSRETLEFIVSWLVEHPDDVRVEEEDSGRTVIYDLFLHPRRRRVIGRSGRVARAIRTSSRPPPKEDRNALVEIVD